MDPDGRKLYFAKGVSDKFKRQFAATVKFMNSKGTAGDLAKLHSSETIYYIGEIRNDQVTRTNHYEGHLISLPNEISPSDLSKMIFEDNNLL